MTTISKKVLVAPLDWGLGHATRCVPVIREFLRQKAEVIIAADGRPAEFLRQEFPDLEQVKLPGYGITYPHNGMLGMHLAVRSPLIGMKIRRERKMIEQIVKEKEIDIIVSDNRFACRSSKTYNVYITHQLNVKAPFAKKMVSGWHKKYYDRFDEVWIPDVNEKINMSGDLGHLEGNNPFIHYVGTLTRFQIQDLLGYRIPKYFITVLISGPEPQRSLFERIMLDEVAKFSEDVLIVRGLPGGGKKIEHGMPHVKMVDHMEDEELKEALLSSIHVVCRPGYSTLCDLSALNINPIVVPTPGQTEQLYLAEHHAAMKHLISFPQKNFNLGKAIREKSQLYVAGIYPDKLALERRVRKVLHK